MPDVGRDARRNATYKREEPDYDRVAHEASEQNLTGLPERAELLARLARLSPLQVDKTGNEERSEQCEPAESLRHSGRCYLPLLVAGGGLGAWLLGGGRGARGGRCWPR